jgi:hypothetical protein
MTPQWIQRMIGWAWFSSLKRRWGVLGVLAALGVAAILLNRIEVNRASNLEALLGLSRFRRQVGGDGDLIALPLLILALGEMLKLQDCITDLPRLRLRFDLGMNQPGCAPLGLDS